MDKVAKIKDSGERQKFVTGSVRDTRTGKGRFDLLSPFTAERLAKWYEAGAIKYGDRNWEKGQPFSRFFDSASRHMNKFHQGLKDEDHLIAALWNLAGIVHGEFMIEMGEWGPELNDMPYSFFKAPFTSAHKECNVTGKQCKGCDGTGLIPGGQNDEFCPECHDVELIPGTSHVDNCAVCDKVGKATA